MERVTSSHSQACLNTLAHQALSPILCTMQDKTALELVRDPGNVGGSFLALG